MTRLSFWMRLRSRSLPAWWRSGIAVWPIRFGMETTNSANLRMVVDWLTYWLIGWLTCWLIQPTQSPSPLLITSISSDCECWSFFCCCPVCRRRHHFVSYATHGVLKGWGRESGQMERLTVIKDPSAQPKKFARPKKSSLTIDFSEKPHFSQFSFTSQWFWIVF